MNNFIVVVTNSYLLARRGSVVRAKFWTPLAQNPESAPALGQTWPSTT